MLIEKFKELTKKFLILSIENIKYEAIISFKYIEQELKIKIFSVNLDDGIVYYDYKTSHNLLLKNSINDYKHTSGPRATPENALYEAFLNLFCLLDNYDGEYEWIINPEF